jgi:hypothetical protein
MGEFGCGANLQRGYVPSATNFVVDRNQGLAEKHSVCGRLADAPRSGAPATYTPEQICVLVAMTCEKPSESERPMR